MKLNWAYIAIAAFIWYALFAEGDPLSVRGMSVFKFGCNKSSAGPFKCSAASPLQGAGVSFECRKQQGRGKHGFACSVDIERLRRNPMNPDVTKNVNPKDL